MATVETYVKLANRPNTQRSYASAIQHFEVEGRGSLPASPDAVAAYLAHFADSLSINTLRARLAGLSKWHRDHGFTDPTKSALVSQVLKGIRTAHNIPEKRARPFEFERMAQVSEWLKSEADQLAPSDPRYLRCVRDQAMLLIGFWRGFRSDELTRLQFEHITLNDGVGMQCFLPYSKGDRESAGQSFFCPALSKLCPVTAFQQWQVALEQSHGPVFRRIDRWGHVSSQGLASGSVVPWLQKLFQEAGVPNASDYSSHSLRRGFANWAKSNGWDLKELMTYIGWRDFNSALRYLDISEEDLGSRFETALENSPSPYRDPRVVAQSRRRTHLTGSTPQAMPSNVVALHRRPIE
ncbi:MAG: site-specific integrase [Rhodoferax sp.]|nr:MAG: site-specific integrase [Rhodoferax sp.]